MKYKVLRRWGKVIIAGESVHYVGGNLALAWEEAFYGLGLTERRWSSVLLVGMGASLMQLLARGAFPPAHLTVIEIDPLMVRLQETHFILPLPYELHIADAAEAVHALTGMYDGIFVDAFVEDIVPERLITEAFVLALKARLADRGLLIWNVLRPMQSAAIRDLLVGAFPVVRRWRYAPHTFWVASHSTETFPTPYY